MKKEVFGYWWQVWEAMDEAKKENIRKYYAYEYEEAARREAENPRYYNGPDTTDGIDTYIIDSVKDYVCELCAPKEENGRMVCVGDGGAELPDYDEDGEALCTAENFLWVLDM